MIISNLACNTECLVPRTAGTFKNRSIDNGCDPLTLNEWEDRTNSLHPSVSPRRTKDRQGSTTRGNDAKVLGMTARSQGKQRTSITLGALRYSRGDGAMKQGGALDLQPRKMSQGHEAPARPGNER